jgi:iron(III) transport system ATP-binding protein
MVLSDRVVVMDRGRVQQAGPPIEVYRRPASRFVGSFLGRASFLPARVLAGPPAAVVDVLGVRFPATGPGAAREGAEATCLLRPEALTIAPAGSAASDGPALRGVVRRAAFLGAVVDYEVELDGGTLAVHDRDVQRDAPLSPGTEVVVRPLVNRVYVLPAGGG